MKFINYSLIFLFCMGCNSSFSEDVLSRVWKYEEIRIDDIKSNKYFNISNSIVFENAGGRGLTLPSKINIFDKAQWKLYTNHSEHRMILFDSNENIFDGDYLIEWSKKDKCLKLLSDKIVLVLLDDSLTKNKPFTSSSFKGNGFYTPKEAGN